MHTSAILHAAARLALAALLLMRALGNEGIRVDRPTVALIAIARVARAFYDYFLFSLVTAPAAAQP